MNIPLYVWILAPSVSTLIVWGYLTHWLARRSIKAVMEARRADKDYCKYVTAKYGMYSGIGAPTEFDPEHDGADSVAGCYILAFFWVLLYPIVKTLVFLCANGYKIAVSPVRLVRKALLNSINRDLDRDDPNGPYANKPL